MKKIFIAVIVFVILMGAVVYYFIDKNNFIEFTEIVRHGDFDIIKIANDDALKELTINDEKFEQFKD